MNRLSMNSIAAPPQVCVIDGPQEILTGLLGFGYNVIDGSTTCMLFQNLDVQYLRGKSECIEYKYFENNHDYETGLAQQIGLDNFVFGMFSRGCVVSPFLNDVVKLDFRKHLFGDFTSELYRLQIVAATVCSFKELDYIATLPFNEDTKKYFYVVFQNYGTHYIKEVSFGQKAEVRSSFYGPDRTKDAFLSVFKDGFESWVQQKFPQIPIPLACNGIMQLDTSMKVVGETGEASLVGFKLTEVSSLFSDSRQANMQEAIRSYVRECRCKSVSSIDGGALVSILCLETNKYVRITDQGRLFADVHLPSHSEYAKFRLYKDPASKNAKPSFRFGLISEAHHTQVTPSSFYMCFGYRSFNLSSAANFLESSDYWLVAGVLTEARFIYVDSATQELMLNYNVDISEQKKSRFCLRELALFS